MFYQSIKHRKSVFYYFSPHYLYSVHLYTREMLDSLACGSFSLMFSNAHHVLSQGHTWLRLIYFNNRKHVLCFYINNRVFLPRNYRLIVAPRKFDVLKTNIFQRSEALRANMLVLRTSNFQLSLSFSTKFSLGSMPQN